MGQLHPTHGAARRIEETISIGRLGFDDPDWRRSLDEDRRRDRRDPDIAGGAFLCPGGPLGRGIALDEEAWGS
jgi:hypothetical protein